MSRSLAYTLALSDRTLMRFHCFTAKFSLSGFLSKSSVENRGSFGVFFLLWIFPAAFSNENGPTIHQTSTKKSTAQIKRQNPRLISGKGCSWHNWSWNRLRHTYMTSHDCNCRSTRQKHRFPHKYSSLTCSGSLPYPMIEFSPSQALSIDRSIYLSIYVSIYVYICIYLRLYLCL